MNSTSTRCRWPGKERSIGVLLHLDVFCQVARLRRLSSHVNGKAITIHLRPELLPPPLGVNQGAETQDAGSPLFLPLGTASAHTHLHDRLARRLRHAAANGQVRLPPFRILHLLVMVGEVR